MREGPAACSTHHGCACCRPASRAKPSPFPPPSAAHTPNTHTDCRRRLTIGFQITGDQLQGTVEVACCTDATHAGTLLGWAGRIDAFSRRVLTAALRAAAHPDTPAHLPAFAAAARDLFRHSAKTLPPNPHGHPRRRARYPVRDTLPDPCIANADALHTDLLAAIDALRTAARHRPCVIITDRAEALSALQELYALFFSYLEHALQPLEPLVAPDAVHAFVLETRHELDDLTACHSLDDGYAETLTITESGDKSVILAIEGSAATTAP